MLKSVPLFLASGMIRLNSSVVSSESVSLGSDEAEEEDWERLIGLVGGSSSDSRLSLGLAVNVVGAVLAVNAVVLDLLFEFC